MIDWVYFWEVSWLPVLALLFPLIWEGFSLVRQKRTFAFNKSTGLKFIILSLGFSITIFSILVFLTGGINSYYFLETGLFFAERDFVWNVTRHVKIQIPYNTGMSLLTVSILSGFVYGGLLIFPPYCEITSSSNSNENQTNSSKLQISTSSVSTVFAGSSALASGVVCCSTSVVAIISPTFAAVLAPVAPYLIVISLMLLNISLIKYVFPRLPTKVFNEY